MQDILDLEVRRTIFELIEKNPGIHQSKIAEVLGLRVSHVEYHLLFLETNGVVNSEKNTGYKRCYINGQIGIKDKRLLSVLRQKTALQIVLYVLKNGRSQHKKIAENVDVSASTLSYHLNKLVKKDVLEVQRHGEKKGYVVKDRKEVVNVLMRYRPYDLFQGFSDVWVDLSI